MESPSVRRKQANQGLREATTLLQAVIPSEVRTRLGEIPIPKFDELKPVNDSALEILSTVDSLALALKNAKASKRKTDLAKKFAEGWFRTSYPFAKLFLNVAQAGSAIPILNPYGLVCSGLIAWIDITYEVTGRSQEIEDSLVKLTNELNRVQLVTDLPKDLHLKLQDDVYCAALDLASSIIRYLTLSIKHAKSGNFAREVFKGGYTFKGAVKAVEVAIKQYNIALVDLGLVAIFKNLEISKETKTVVENLNNNIEAFGDIPAVMRQQLESFALQQMEALNGAVVRSQTEIVLVPSKEKILKWLFPGEVDLKHRDVRGKRMNNSGLWFLNLPALQKWMSGEGSNILYCPGLPGAGKTVITSVLIDHINNIVQRDQHDVALGYFYFDYANNHHTVRVDAVLASLLKQLTTCLKEITPDLYNLYKKLGDRIGPDRSQLITQLLSVGEQFKSAFIVLDALDEYDTSELWTFLDALKQLSKSFRIYLTSRPHLSRLNKAFHSESFTEIEIVANASEIQRYLNERVENKAFSEDVKQQITARLAATKAEGVYISSKLEANSRFLLAEAQANFALDSRLPRNIMKALENPVPTELFKLYDIILENIQNAGADTRDMAEKTLSWIFRAKRPMKTNELIHAISIFPGDTDIMQEYLPLLDLIIEECGSLIHHDTVTGTLVFAHKQVQQFLATQYSARLLTDIDIAKTCLTYFLFDVFEKDICKDRESFVQQWQVYPLASYSAKYFGYHTKGAGEQEKDVQKLLLEVLRSSKRIDTILQMSIASEESVWEKGNGTAPRLRKNTWAHLLAFYNLSGLFETVAKCSNDGYAINAEGVSAFIELLKSGGYFDVNEGGWTAVHFAASEGHFDTLKLLIETGNGRDVHRVTNHQVTLLSLASATGKVDCVHYLLSKGANPFICSDAATGNVTPLHLAVSHGHKEVVEALIHSNVDIQARRSNGWTVLHNEEFSGNVEIAKLLLNAKADVTAQEEDRGTTPLHTAALQGNREVVKLLLDASADVSARTRQGFTPLHLAAMNGDEGTMEFLLNSKGDPSAHSDNGWIPLHFAALNGFLGIVRLLSKGGTDAWLRDASGRSALECASEQGHVEVVKYLLDAGPAVVVDKFGTTLHGAARNGHTEIIEILLEAGATTSDVDSLGFTPLHLASQLGQLQSVKKLLSANAGVLIQDHQGWIPLHHAAAYGHCDILNELLGFTSKHHTSANESFSIDMKTTSGLSALSLAVLNHHEDIVKRLLQANANTSLTTADGWNPLHIASWSGDDAIVKHLLLAKADPSSPSMGHLKLSPLHVAAMRGQVDIVQQLLDAKADLSLVDGIGCTPLHSAAHWGFEGVLKILLESDINPFVQDRDGKTALHYAATTGSVEIVELLLERDIDDRNKMIAMESITGIVALHCAASNGNLRVVDKLLGYDALPSVKDHDGLTALHFASQMGRENVVRRLLKLHSIDPSLQDKNGNSPLHWAATRGHIEVVKMLLEVGASVEMTNLLGLTPLCLAAYFNQPSIVTELLNAIGIDCASDWYEVGTTTAAGDQISSGTTCLEFLITKFPENYVLLIILGERFYVLGECEKAAETFDKIVSLERSNLEAEQISDVLHPLYACYACKATSIHGYLHLCSVCDMAFCQICADNLDNVHRDHGLLVIPSQRWISKHLSTRKESKSTAVGDNSIDELTVGLQTTQLQTSESTTGLATE